MKPWFIWNGRDSRDMGLVVESLPPITRPAMRVSTMEIDGRDGDEVVELGYEAYDKEIVFGIKKTTEEYLNSLMYWLSGDGELITSVEPTKKYYCKIYEVLDLERLCRFRKGGIRLHTQPYKYAVSESAVEWSGSNKVLQVQNQGNTSSAPLITVTGSGVVNISVDGTFVCKLDLGEDDMIIMDSAEMEAYDNTSLRNRDMTGDFVCLPPGGHEITWDGDITALAVVPKSRWI